MTAFNFINSIIGSGIVAMPYALKEAGFGLGILLVLIVTAVTDYSLVLLIRAGELSNTNTYQDVVRAAFGRSGFIVLTVIQFLYPFIAMVSYNVILGDTVTKLVLRIAGPWARYTIIARREFIITAATLLITLPLSLYRNITRLVKVSLVSIAFIVFVIGVMIARAFTNPVEPTPDAWQFANTGVTRAISIMAYAFMCHHNSFLIYDSLVDANTKRWGIVTHFSVLFSMACTLVLGITGYTTFTGFTQGDVLENYCRDDDLVNVARLLFAVAVLLTFPVECFVTREVIENSVFAFTQPPSTVRHISVTVIIVLLTVIVSLTTDCVGIVLELNGVINASPLAYILPALCVLKLQQVRIISWQNAPCILTALFGVAVSVVGLIMAAVEIAGGLPGCSHGNEMPYCTAAGRLAQQQQQRDGVPSNQTWRLGGF